MSLAAQSVLTEVSPRLMRPSGAGGLCHAHPTRGHHDRTQRAGHGSTPRPYIATDFASSVSGLRPFDIAGDEYLPPTEIRSCLYCPPPSVVMGNGPPSTSA